MLRDAEILRLRRDERYQKVTRTALKAMVRDLLSSGKGELKPDLSLLLQLAYRFTRARLIRQELHSTSVKLLERLVNYELYWPRNTQSIRYLCESEQSFLWMRFDEPRVDALFKRSTFLMTDAEFRELLKTYSSRNEDKNHRLAELSSELESCFLKTLRSIATRGLFDDFLRYNASEFYSHNEAFIQQQFLKASTTGLMGALPDPVE